MYSISAKIHGIKQKLKGDQYIQLDTDRFNEILDELTTWLHFDPAAQKQAAEHWADEHGTLGHEHPIADHLAAAQQFTATICEPAEHRSNLELLRQRHDSNAAEQWQDGECKPTDNLILFFQKHCVFVASETYCVCFLLICDQSTCSHCVCQAFPVQPAEQTERMSKRRRVDQGEH